MTSCTCSSSLRLSRVWREKLGDVCGRCGRQAKPEPDRAADVFGVDGCGERSVRIDGQVTLRCGDFYGPTRLLCQSCSLERARRVGWAQGYEAASADTRLTPETAQKNPKEKR